MKGWGEGGWGEGGVKVTDRRGWGEGDRRRWGEGGGVKGVG